MSGNDATMRRWMLTGASALAAKKRRAAVVEALNA